MKVLDRYLGRTVAGATATVLLFLICAFTFFGFLEEINDLGKGEYGLLAAVEFTLLKTPGLIYQLFPPAALIGSLLGLGGLVGRSEMVAIRAAGVSLARTIAAIMKAAAVLVIIALLIGELVAPETDQMARNLRSMAMFDQIMLRTRNGFWARDGNSFVNIQNVTPDNRVEAIHIYEFDTDNKLRISTYANSAEYKDGQWLLSEISQSEFHDDRVTVHTAKHATWRSLLRPELVGMLVINPDQLSLWDLARYIHYLRQNSQNALRYEQALWTKLTYPLATAAMVFLAIPMVFASARVRSVGSRVLVGSLVGLVFRIASQAFANLGVVLNLNPAVSVLTPTLIVVAAGIVLLRRVS